jgi:hypothetical protein
MQFAATGQRGLAMFGLLLTSALVGCGAATSPTSKSTAYAPSRTKSEPTTTIRLAFDDKHPEAAAFEVIGLSANDTWRLASVGWDESRWNALLAVYVAPVGVTPDGAPAGQNEKRSDLKDGKSPPDHLVADRPAVLGAHRVAGGALRFEPQYPLQPGLAYDVVLDLSRLPQANAAGSASRAANAHETSSPIVPLTQRLQVPKPPAVATTMVAHVYPSANELPENLLKFYLHFSAPMSRGEAYSRVHLLDSAGHEVQWPFLELDEELWDPAGKRFTLFFDPGRVKRELVPRLEMGPALVEGKKYTLVVDKDWLDAAGNQLREPYRKEFHVVAPDDKPPTPDTWKITPPVAGTSTPLEVVFPEALDHALLTRQLWVENEHGEVVAGVNKSEEAETRWQFTPKTQWQTGKYRIQVDTTLEDLAGNSIGRPFEVDVFNAVERRVEPKRVAIPFEVHSTDSAN